MAAESAGRLPLIANSLYFNGLRQTLGPDNALRAPRSGGLAARIGIRCFCRRPNYMRIGV